MKSRIRLSSLVALLFVVYAVADVSVLQAFCGNEALGIPPAHHVNEAPDHHLDHRVKTCTESSSFGCHEVPDGHEYEHKHECFCSQLAVVGHYFLKSDRTSYSGGAHHSFSYSAPFTNTDHNQFFRPPRSA